METEKIIIDIETKSANSLKELDQMLKDSSTSAAKLNAVIKEMEAIANTSNAAYGKLAVGTKDYVTAVNMATKANENLAIAKAKVASAIDIKIPSTASMIAPYAAVEGTINAISVAADRTTTELISMDNAMQSAVAATTKDTTTSTFTGIQTGILGVKGSLNSVGSAIKSNEDSFDSLADSAGTNAEKAQEAWKQAMVKVGTYIEGVESYETDANGVLSRIIPPSMPAPPVGDSGASSPVGALEDIEEASRNTGNSLEVTSRKARNLNMAISQVAREAPNFAFSMQIGLMSLSNNLPILGEAFMEAKKSGVNMGKAIASSLFSMNMLIVGVTIALQFLPKIIDFISEKFDGMKSAVDSVTTAKQALNDANKKGIADAQKEITNLQILYSAATSASRALNDRTLAVKEIKKQYPSYFKNMSDEYIMAGKASGIYRSLTMNIIESAKARAKAEQINRLASEQWRMQMNQAGTLMELQEKQLILDKKQEANRLAVKIGRTDLIENLTEESNAVVKLKQKYNDQDKAARSLGKSMQELASSIKISDYIQDKLGEPTKSTKSTKSEVAKYTNKFTGETTPESIAFEKNEMIRANDLDSLDQYNNERQATIENANEGYSNALFGREVADIDHALKIEEARRKDIKNTQDYYKKKLDLALSDLARIPILQQELDANNIAREAEVKKLNELFITKAKLKDDELKLEDKFQKDLANAKSNNEKTALTKKFNVDSTEIKASSKSNDSEISFSKDALSGLDKSGKDIASQLEKIKDAPNAIADMQTKIKDGDAALATSLGNTTSLLSDSVKAKMDVATAALDAMGGFTDGIVGLYKQQQAAADDRYNAEADRIKESNMNEADKTKALEMNEKARYEEKKKLFEKQKKWEEASAWINFASGVVGIWKGSTALGPIAGPIVAGVQTAALLATTVANVKTIRAQKIDAPSSGSKSSSDSSSASLSQLTPVDTALKSRDEDLDTIRTNGSRNQSVSIVKVSDINNVQSIVSVREANSTF